MLTFDIIEPKANMDYEVTVNLQDGSYNNTEDLYDSDYPSAVRSTLKSFEDEFIVPDNFEEVRNED